MVDKTKISIGILLLILLSTGVVYVEWKNDARIRVDEDKSTFYIKENNDGIILSDGTCNVMPGVCVFKSVKEAKKSNADNTNKQIKA